MPAFIDESDVSPFVDWTFSDEVNASFPNVTSPPAYDVMSNPWLRATLVTLYSVIFLLGLSGNALVVYVVVRNKSLHSPTNVFIANLGLSDIMMCLLAVPFTIFSGLSNSWIFGRALCHVVPMSLGVSVHVSSLTSIAIAVDRYCAIVHPFRARISVRACCGVILAVWVASVGVSLPLAAYMKTWEVEEGVVVCDELWPSITTRQVYTVTSLVLQYLVPCAIISVCYGLVSGAVDRRAKAKRGMDSYSKQRRGNPRECITEIIDEAGSTCEDTGRRGDVVISEKELVEIRRKTRMNRMLIAMVAIFVCCWMPLNVINLTADYVSQLREWEYFLLLFFAAHVIAMSSTVYNPFLYAWMNEAFRSEFRSVLPWLFTADGYCVCCGCCVPSRDVRGRLTTQFGVESRVYAKTTQRGVSCGHHCGKSDMAVSPKETAGL